MFSPDIHREILQEFAERQKFSRSESPGHRKTNRLKRSLPPANPLQALMLPGTGLDRIRE